jgi:GntR family transcriptional regulator
MAAYSYPQELQRSFEADIVTGALAAGQWFSISELQDRYEVDGVDLRRVLWAAYRKGLLEKNSVGALRVRGERKGTIYSVFQHAAKSGLSPTSIVRAVEIVPASNEIARKINVAEDTPIFRQTRTRLVNGEVIANQNNYIPIEVCPGLETVDLATTSFQEVLEGRFHTVVARIAEHFEIRPASAQDIEVLGLGAGANVLIVERVSLSSNDLPLVYADIHVRTDRYHYVKELWPEAAALLAAPSGGS